jgi:hypothetical protein
MCVFPCCLVLYSVVAVVQTAGRTMQSLPLLPLKINKANHSLLITPIETKRGVGAFCGSVKFELLRLSTISWGRSFPTSQICLH